MKKFVEKYRPVRQRAVRGKSTTDKAGSTDELAPQRPSTCEATHVRMTHQLMSDLHKWINTRVTRKTKDDHDIVPPTGTISRSGRLVRARFRLDLKGTLVDIINEQMINLKV